MEEIDHTPLMFELNGMDGKSTPSFNPEFRLLLVDDDVRLLDSLCELLKGLGYKLKTASSGKDDQAHLSDRKSTRLNSSHQ